MFVGDSTLGVTADKLVLTQVELKAAWPQKSVSFRSRSSRHAICTNGFGHIDIIKAAEMVSRNNLLTVLLWKQFEV